ncbi:phage holin family protein [Corynebacterium vitaeruminis]|uniref:phage holin family protein n=1 Tax=Corynebacterium vitaeruminis TaxID=38305 RepID=UPI0023F4FAB3|nr:phage holin family protein [Corynebacterium vitaeruminis]
MTGFLRLALNVVLTAVALYAVTLIVPGVSITPADNPWAFVWVALVFIVINTVAGPIARFLSFPITFLTLGLFGLVINALLFLLTDKVSTALGLGLSVEGFGAAFIGAIVMAIAMWIIDAIVALTGLRR